MKFCFLTTLLLQFSLNYGQATYNFKLNQSYPVPSKKTICLNSNNCLFFKRDKTFSYLLLYHSNSGFKRNALRIIDSVDVTPYTSRVYCFCSDIDKKEFVVLWETAYESLSCILAYYLKGNQLFKIGDLKISLNCKTCEYFGYPIKSICIKKVDDNIEFSFLEDLNFWKSGSEEEMFKVGKFKYQFNIKQKNLKIITNK